MKIHEYQAKELFKDYDINIPEGYVGENKDEILKIYKSFDDDVVLKVQVHAGGRGKAGGVRLVKSEQEVIEFAEKFFGKGFQTIQTENEEFIVKNTDRIAQMVLMPILKINFEEVEELPDTVRGTGGFGSTGKWKKT